MRYRIKPIWHVIFALVLALAAAHQASAQIPNRPLAGLSQVPPALAKAPEVKIDTEGYVPTVSVWHPSFEPMCKELARRLGAEDDIHLMPKPLPPSRERYQGDMWVVEAGGKQLEVNASELPKALRGIRGDATRVIYRGTCYLKDNYFYSTEHVVFITESVADARTLASAIR